jgi:hypothetical protein
VAQSSEVPQKSTFEVKKSSEVIRGSSEEPAPEVVESHQSVDQNSILRKSSILSRLRGILRGKK